MPDQSLPNTHSDQELEPSNPSCESFSNLDISSEFQRDEPTVKSGWGQLPKESRFGLEQKRAMLRAGAVCDRQYGLKQVVLTGTLPGSTNEANYALACYSGYAMNRLLQWVRRIVGENWTFGVWEYQKRGALHYHLATCYETESQALQIEAGFKSQWIKILADISDRAGVDLFDTGEGYSHRMDTSVVQADVKRLRKSCAAYFSKYASKGYGKAVKSSMHKSGLVQFCPSRWIVLSRPVSRAIKEQSFAYSVDGGRQRIEEMVENWLHKLEQLDCLRFAYKHKVIAGKTYVFYFNDEEFGEASEAVHEAFRSKIDHAQSEYEPQAERAMSPLPCVLPVVLRRPKNKLQKRNGGRVSSRKVNLCGNKRVLVPLESVLWVKQLELWA